MDLAAKLAGAVPFAHLLGIRAKVEDDEEKKSRAEDDEEVEDDEEEKDAEDDEKSYEGEEDEDDKEAEEDEEEPDAEEEDDKKDAKKAKQAGRMAERARCKAIFNCAAAGVRPDMAAHLAFNTNMKAAEAIPMLKAMVAGTPKQSRLSDRMAQVSTPNPGVDGGKAANTIAEKMVSLYNQHRK